MTRDEAVAVIRAAQEADNGCDDCAATVIRELCVLLPSVDWLQLLEELRLGTIAALVEECY